MPDLSKAPIRLIFLGAVLAGAAFAGGFFTGKRMKTSVSSGEVSNGICWHLDGSRWECPDSLVDRKLFAAGNDILNGYLTLTTARGEQTFTLPAGVDAIFLSPAGLQILQAHYVATDSAKAAAVGQYLDSMRR